MAQPAKIERGFEWDRRGRPPLVVVEWEDCETTAGWSAVKDAVHARPKLCVQVGCLLGWDKTGLRMVGGYALDEKGEVGEVCEATVIPGGWVKGVKAVGDA